MYSIRDAAANNLKRLAEEFGPEWAMQHIIPQVCLVMNSYDFLIKHYQLQNNFDVLLIWIDESSFTNHFDLKLSLSME